MRQAGPGGPLIPMTIRLTPGAWQAIRDIATDNCISQAELVRITLSNKLYRYLGDVRIVDKQQAADIRLQIGELCTEMSIIKNELHKIGVNYNQTVKAQNIVRKCGSNANTGIKENDDAVLPKTEIDILMDRYEQATEKVRDICRILV